jgi:hypothetical protein
MATASALNAFRELESLRTNGAAPITPHKRRSVYLPSDRFGEFDEKDGMTTYQGGIHS